jgi:hypothetical protein
MDVPLRVNAFDEHGQGLVPFATFVVENFVTFVF